MKTLLQAFILVFITNYVFCETPAADRAILVDFFYSLGGTGWADNTNWLDGDPCLNSWFGVTCGTGDVIVYLQLPGNNLQGTIIENFLIPSLHTNFVSIFS